MTLQWIAMDKLFFKSTTCPASHNIGYVKLQEIYQKKSATPVLPKRQTTFEVRLVER
jgi:hypothetical protein